MWKFLGRLNVDAVKRQPTDWVNNLVIMEKKNGSLRLCLDPRDLNKAAKHVQNPHNASFVTQYPLNIGLQGSAQNMSSTMQSTA